MYGDVDSLNLSVATSIILAESVNQRKNLLNLSSGISITRNLSTEN